MILPILFPIILNMPYFRRCCWYCRYFIIYYIFLYMYYYIYICLLGNGSTRPVRPLKKKNKHRGPRKLCPIFFWFLIKFLQKCSLSLFQTHLFLLGHPRFSSHHRLGSLFLFMGILCRSNGHRIAQAQCLTPTVWLSHFSSLSCTKGQAGSDWPISP